MRRASWASTSLRSMSRGLAIAWLIAFSVISWNTMRRTFILAGGFSTSFRCQAMASPSRSSSVARYSSEALASRSFSFLTWAFFSAGTT